MSYLQAIIIAIIEGITEFLPISSTGHMIIASSFMKIAQDDFTKLFIIVIQLGAIFSVIVLYWKRFFQSVNFYLKLLVAFLPAAFLGLLFNNLINSLLENPVTVAVSLVFGGLILLKVDAWFPDSEETITNTNVTYSTALKIGFFQTIAMIPGVSRSGATIVGGMTQKLCRRAAAEFSFFLAIPTMLGATCLKLYEYFNNGFVLTTQQYYILILGNVIAFIVAMIAIKSFIEYLTKHGFKLFGYYRVLVGIAILVIHYFIYPITTI
ncbi:MAG: undecaprenyl-diphosphate phosphatase [Bacteroidetes bacterium]|nr:undecaprenyl-diphosphate phosphatase [Bacteroidota bacterium]